MKTLLLLTLLFSLPANAYDYQCVSRCRMAGLANCEQSCENTERPIVNQGPDYLCLSSCTSSGNSQNYCMEKCSQ